MITIRPMTEADSALIQSTLTHPLVYPRITDDGSPAVDKFQVVFGNYGYLGAWDAETFLGLWMCVRVNAATIEVHTCLLPLAAGPKGLQAANACAAWIWANTDFDRIVTNVPEFNRLALRFAERAGMVQYGENVRSYRKDGVLHNEILLGLSRPESGGDPCQR
jgi:hypothetical protein